MSTTPRNTTRSSARKPRLSKGASKDTTYKDQSDSESADSDALDDSDAPSDKRPSKKRKAPSPRNKQPVRKRQKPSKDDKSAAEEDEDEDDFELQEGQKIIGSVVQAPKTGRVPPGQISRNTLNFLALLAKPENNDRKWFKLREPVFRVAEKEWKDFIDEFVPLLIEADPQIPHLPSRDMVHRIYNDVRFKTDKTPYKTGFSASTSRGGRKGHFAHYHFMIKPNNLSVIAGGAWQPERQDLANIRASILRSPARLRAVIADPVFVKYFGKPEPHSEGKKQSIFGGEDQLKVAPKGVDKDHPDIDLLKCRTIAVFHRFTDEQVADPDFKNELKRVAGVLRPFIHCLNEMMTLPPDDDDDADGGDEANDEEADASDAENVDE